MSDIGQVITFASQLYRQRTRVRYAGYVRQDPMALLELRPGRENPYPVYARLRTAGPLTRTRLGDWVSPGHRVCDAVLRDRRFGVRLDDGSPPDFDASFLSMNPPDHTRLRRLALPAFSPKAVATYQPRIERAASDLIDRANSAAGQFDLVSGFSAPLPIAVITDLLGIPDSRSGDFARYGAVIGSALDGIKSLRQARQLMANQQELVQLFEDLLELRRREPRDDIVSHLVAAQGDRITADEMLSMCILLLVAGFETTVNLISNAVLALLGHPAQWEALGADPDLAPRAVEEVLRWDPPLQRTERVALTDLELAGQQVRRGEKVITLIGAANRDPEVYRDPDTFDIMREPEVSHLAFSSGIHYCLGQPLARLEATAALSQLAARMPGLARRGTVTWRNATIIRGPLRMPVTAGPLPVPAHPAPAHPTPGAR